MPCDDRQFDIGDIFKGNTVCLRVYIGTEVTEDPFEKNVATVNINPIPVQAIFLQDFNATQSQWKMPGLKTSRAKEFLIKKIDIPTIEKSSKIEFEGINYEGWRENGRLQQRDAGIYTRIVIYSKHTE